METGAMKGAVKYAVFFVVICCLQVTLTSCSKSSGTSWRKFAGCIRRKLGLPSLVNPRVICAATQMALQFNKMTYGCLNCDKYFHCQANYNAVANCRRSNDARKTAAAISDCREFSQGGTDPDSREDQVANRHGRSLKSCAKYLCPKNCKYNPRNGSCRKQNC